MSKTKIVYFASGGDVFRMGPYETAVEAWEALIQTRVVQSLTRSVHPLDAKVWPERVWTELE